MSSNDDKSVAASGGDETKGKPKVTVDDPSQDVTLTDKLNKKLLTSLLDRLNKQEDCFVTQNSFPESKEEDIPDEEFEAECSPDDIRNAVLAQKK